MPHAHRALHLAARPEGMPKDTDFELRSDTLPDLEEGQLRVAVKYVSIDPAMRVWMSEAKSYWPPVGARRSDARGGDRRGRRIAPPEVRQRRLGQRHARRAGRPGQ
jgi:hypothetical protein